MKPNEIMIGDWVRRRWTCTDTGREVVKDFQVTEIRKNGDTLYAWSKNGNMGRVKDLEPIPLTPEILEKNGFYLNGIEDYNKPTFNIDYGKWAYANEDDFDVVGDSADIKYVHQLQHALRLCCWIDLDIVI